MKTPVFLFSLTLGWATVFTGCDLFMPVSPPISDRQAAADLRDLSTRLLPLVTNGLAFAQPGDAGTRALDITTVDWNTWLAGKGITNSSKPSDIWAAAGGTGSVSTEFTVPAQPGATVTVLASFNNGNQDRFYFTISKDTVSGPDYFRLKLYTFPALDYNIVYVLEEYLVSDSNTNTWAWTNMDINKVSGGWINYQTKYVDGSVGTKTSIQTSATGGPKYAALGTVGGFGANEPYSNIGQYLYTGTQPTLVTDAAATWSSYVVETMKLQNQNFFTIGYQYYTEIGGKNYGLTYYDLSQNGWKNQSYTIVRSYKDPSTGLAASRAVTSTNLNGTSSNKVFFYQVDSVLVQPVSGTSGPRRYQSRQDIFNSNNALTLNPATSVSATLLDLTENSDTPPVFSGTQTVFTGTSGVVYNVQMSRTVSGMVTLSSVQTGTTTRSAGAAMTVNLGQLGTLSWTTSRGYFSGNYENGRIHGQYTVGSQVFNVTAGPGYVGVGGNSWLVSALP